MTAVDLRRNLDRAVGHGAAHLRSASGRRAVARTWARALRWGLLVPAAAVVVQLGRGLAGMTSPRGWFAAVVVVSVAVPLAFVAMRWLAARRRRIERAAALATVEDALKSEDRLLAADDFLDHPAPSGFMRAAIDDARGYVERAADVALTAPGETSGAGLRGAWPLAGAAVLLAIAYGLSGWTRANTGPEITPAGDGAPPLVALATDDTEPGSTPPPGLAPEPEARPEARPRTQRRAGAGAPFAGSLPDQMSEASGRLGTGETSESDRSSSPSDARGAPSSQGQPAKPGKPSSKKPAKPKQQKPSEAQPEPEKKRDPEPAGSTSGQGSSRGSNRNPAVSDWSSRDQVATPDDEELTDEEEVDDEEEEQESRGGIQPNLRDRRPPANRDLNIGFGNQNNPDANGRGGPSERKKSRGVAALVLGVPIPDRVKGQPNPGRTKVTQQRVEPEREAADPATAEARPPRAGGIGPVHDADLTPWMRDFVRAYFLSLREATADAGASASTPDDEASP